ncbi:precorrin-2/cobalt-factor-2 C20-methyltransferase [Zavarzinia compransoris]|nr:precorrin-2/cobalt-factor-2 C20-methyltransferase [Zavarzinia compransoris]
MATLYGVGIGPGDPELLTLKAARIVGAVPVVAYFCKAGRPGHARTIAAPHLNPAAAHLRLEYPFTIEVPVGDPRYLIEIGRFYDAAAEQVGAELDQGRDVAVICEGDPFFYGSFMYLYDRLRDRFPTEVIPGITGMGGCWTRAGSPITHGDDVLTVLPGTLGAEAMAARLAGADAAVIMKVGRNLPKIRAALQDAGLLTRAIYVERGTMADEAIRPLAAVEGDDAPYFALILVPGRQRPR